MDGPAEEAVRVANGAQQQATAPDATVWVNASAGTGKTKVLTDRVLRLLLAGSAPDKLLCITFTKAAAANMADRVRGTLSRWATGSQTDLVEHLLALLGRAPEQQEIERARHLFAAVLDAPGGLKILTIHAFCQSLLRRFPVEAGVSPHFELMDDRAAAELLHGVRTRILADPPADCVAAVDHLAMQANEEQIAGLVDDLLRNRATLLREMGEEGDAEALIARLRDHLDVADGETADSVLTTACDDAALDGAGLTAAAKALQTGSATAAGFGSAILDWLARSAAERVAGWADYRAAFLTGKGDVRSRSFLDDKTVKDDPAARAALSAEAERILAVDDRLARLEALADNAALYRLAAALIATYEAAKRARGVLDYDDLIIRADALLSTPGRAAWVLYKLDRGIDHVLIDEAQDTNPEQWELVKALVADFFAGAGPRADIPRTLFVVGDEKQSIFTFQGADPEAFAGTRQHLAERVAGAERPFAEVPLTVSFRSVQAVLDAVDATFEEDAPVLGLGQRYQPHRAARAGAGGTVELWPLVPESEGAPVEAWTPPLERDRTVPPAVRLADAVAERVDAMIGNERLEALDRPVAPGDVLILVRKRDAFFAEVVRALKRRGVPVAGVDRMTLSEQMAVKDLMVLGQVLLLPDDDLALATLLRTPLIDLPDKRLFDLAHGRQGTLWAALRAAADTDAMAARIVDWLRDLMAATDFTGPFGLFAGVLARPCPADPDGSGRRALVRRLGLDAEDPIDEFLDLADRFEQTYPAALQRFMHWLGAAETELKREMEAGAGEAVRLMTVHGAKGLQGRVVILADTQVGNPTRPPILWPRDGSPLPIWVRAAKDRRDAVSQQAVERYEQRRMAEDKRLLYVAMTRAEDRLIVTGIEAKRKSSGGEDVPSLRWHELVDRGLRRLAEVAVSPFAPWEGEHLVLHRPQTAPPECDGSPAPAPPPAAALPDYLRRPPPEEPDPPRPLSPSRPDLPDPAARSPVGEGGAERFKRGLLLHALLQYLPDMPPDRREAAARRYLAQPGHGLDQEEQDVYAREVMAVLDDPGVAALFGPDSRAEVPITARLGRRVVSGQVDRLVVTPDKVIVLDWKTNRPPPRRPEDVDRAYLTQMAAYRAALSQMMGGRPVDCVLGWTDGPALMRLPDALLDQYAPGGAEGGAGDAPS